MRKIAILLIAGAAFASACTGSRWVRTPVAEQHEFNVTLEQRQEKGTVVQQRYAHPSAIDISALEKLMGGLRYSEKSGLMRTEKQSPVFQAVEIDRLAPVLAATLAKAEASQRIRFTSFNQGQSLIFSVPRKTEGVVFVEPAGRLNFAFSYINANRQSSETTAIDPVYSSADPLKIQVSDTIIAATAPYAELHKFASGKQAPMWVVVDLEKLEAAISTATVPPVKAAEDVAPAMGSKDPAVEKTAPEKASEGMLKEDIRNKLKYLKELLDEGLISEQDYTVKKKELLDKIN